MAFNCFNNGAAKQTGLFGSPAAIAPPQSIFGQSTAVLGVFDKQPAKTSIFGAPVTTTGLFGRQHTIKCPHCHHEFNAQ